jgi:hypothetical protein
MLSPWNTISNTTKDFTMGIAYEGSLDAYDGRDADWWW